MRLEGVSFRNSASCDGIAFTDSAANLDIAEITIRGRYPDTGWAVNTEVHEMAYIKSGVGSLAIRNASEIKLTEGDVVSIPPNQRFAWNGNMTIIMACNPPFNREQYRLEDDV